MKNSQTLVSYLSPFHIKYLHVWPRRIRKFDVVKSYISFKRFMLDDCSLSGTGVEWGNLPRERKKKERQQVANV